MNFIDRWRIARGLDSSRELPEELARRIDASDELSEYCSRLERVERGLRRGQGPNERVAPGFTEDVLSRIRSEASRTPPARRWRPILAGAAGAAALTAAALLALRPPTAVAPVESPSVTASWRVPATLSTPVEQPLVREARLLARDTRRAADMVLASFPSARPGR